MTDTIFNIVQSNNSGGMENVYLDYANILNKNFNIICITSKNFIHLEKLKAANIKTEILNIKGHYDIVASIKLFLLIKKHSPKLIIAHNGRGFALVNLYKKLFCHKSLTTLAISHGGRIKRLLNFNSIITVAKHLEKPIKEKNFKGKLETIYNAIHIRPYNLIQKKHPDFTFGILSRLSPEKNIITAIEAFEIFIQKTTPDTKLIIAGDGPELKSLKQIIHQKHLQKHITFLGWIRDKEKFFNNIDTFLQPASDEPFGLTILESFNYHVPVISVNSCGPKEIITHNKNGYLYQNATSKSELYTLMHKIYNNQDHIPTITQNAYQGLEHKFSYQNLEKKLTSFITTELINNPKTTD